MMSKDNMIFFLILLLTETLILNFNFSEMDIEFISAIDNVDSPPKKKPKPNPTVEEPPPQPVAPPV
jgi:hypothetical protein